MMTHSLLIAALALMLATLAGCGVDGPPTRPQPPQQAQAGVHVSGEARAGVTTRL